MIQYFCCLVCKHIRAVFTWKFGRWKLAGPPSRPTPAPCTRCLFSLHLSSISTSAGSCLCFSCLRMYFFNPRPASPVPASPRPCAPTPGPCLLLYIAEASQKKGLSLLVSPPLAPFPDKRCDIDQPAVSCIRTLQQLQAHGGEHSAPPSISRLLCVCVCARAKTRSESFIHDRLHLKSQRF